MKSLLIAIAVAAAELLAPVAATAQPALVIKPLAEKEGAGATGRDLVLAG